ncbi:hypothetical protein D3C85_1546280 [compost metagenome]
MLSRRNSGFTATPKSTPAFLPEQSSRIGITTLFTVPGNTVLRTTTVCRSDLSRRAKPISRQTPSTKLRPRSPFFLLGVPTQINDTSVAAMASDTSVVPRRRPA